VDQAYMQSMQPMYQMNQQYYIQQVIPDIRHVPVDPKVRQSLNFTYIYFLFVCFFFTEFTFETKKFQLIVPNIKSDFAYFDQSLKCLFVSIPLF